MLTVRIKEHERGLWLRHGNVQRLVGPGRYRLWSRLWSGARDRIEVYSTLNTRFEHALLDVLVGHADVDRALLIVELSEVQRALVW